MHEVAVTQAIITAITEKTGEARIRLVRLEIGVLSGVLADAVRFCFDLVAEGTPVEGATLVVDEPPGRARCRNCSTPCG